jgi:hypothetical protein
MSEADAGPAIHKADPAARRKLLLLGPLGVGALLLLAWWFHGYLDNLPVESGQQMIESTQEVIDEIQRVLYCAAALFAVLAAYWMQRGRSVDAVPQYPPPEMLLFHDMLILRGQAKHRYARRLYGSAVVGGLLAGLMLVAAVLVPRKFQQDNPVLFAPQSHPPAAAPAAAAKPPT